MNSLVQRRRLLSLLLFSLTISSLPNQSAQALSAPEITSVTSISPAGTAVNEARVRVEWTHGGTAASYFNLKYRTGADSYTVVSGINASLRQYTVENLLGGRTYQFIVSAVSVALSGSLTEQPSTITNGTPTSVPVAPDVIDAVAGVASVTLTWTEATADQTGGLPLTAYVISYGSDSLTVSPSLTERKIDGLNPGSTYDFTLKAVNSLGASESDNFPSATVFDRPARPTTVTLSAVSRTVTVNWAAPTDGGSPITSYRAHLIRTSGAGAPVEVDSATTANGSVRTLNFNSVQNGDYTAQVVATNAVGTSLRSTETPSVTINVSASLQDNTPVFTPNNVTTLQVDDQRNLRITAPSGDSPTVVATPEGTCSYENGVLRALKGGTCSVKATVSASGSFDSGEKTIEITITRLSQTINFASISDQSAPGSVPLVATLTPERAGSGVTFSAQGNCDVVNNNSLTTRAGSCTVTASLTTLASERYVATVVSRTFTTAAGGSSGFSGGSSSGGAVVSGVVAGVVTQDTANATNAPVTVRIQGTKPVSETDPLSSEICIQVRSVLLVPVVQIQRCALPAVFAEFTLAQGDYVVTVSDPAGKRSIATYSLSVSREGTQVTNSQVLANPTRFQVPVGALIVPVVKVETPATTSGSTGTTPSASETSSATSSSTTKPTTASPETTTAVVELVPIVTKTVRNAKSTLPRISNSAFATVPAASRVSRLEVSSPRVEVSISRSRPFQIKVPITAKKANVTVEIKRSGEKKIPLNTNLSVKRGEFLGHLITFKKRGSYTITVTVGKEKSRIVLSVKK